MGVGMERASTHGMGVRRFQDLVCWQLSLQLHGRIVAIVARGSVRRDRGFCDQLLRASGAAAPNIAEGFARFSKPEFRRFLRYAIASLSETQTLLEQGRQRGHIVGEELEEVATLACRAAAAATRLHRSIPGPPTDLADTI